MTKADYALDFEKPLRDLQARVDDLLASSREHHVDVSRELRALERRLEEARARIYSNLTPWQRVQLARHPRRPYSLDFIKRLFRDFQELRGDRVFGDDQAIIGGTAWFGDQPVVVIAQQKGRDVKENLRRNFGMPHPEGYRKALRLMKLAEKFGLPIISFIDTKAAFAGVASEERHVSEAIARNLQEMALLRVPTVGVILGEGGSGGALGIAVVDRLLVLEYAYYSVIPPEGCAAILWRDRKFAERAANALRLGARELVEQQVADEVIPEPPGGAHLDHDAAAHFVKPVLERHLEELLALDEERLVEERYRKYRRLGPFVEAAEAELARAAAL